MENRDKRDKYNKLLAKFCSNDELIELIEECELDERGKREFNYLKTNRYPEQRELLGKLKTDLILKRREVLMDGRNS